MTFLKVLKENKIQAYSFFRYIFATYSFFYRNNIIFKN